MPAAYEEMLAYVLAQLSEPIEQETDDQGAVIISSGYPGEVIVRLTESDVTVAEYAAERHGPLVQPFPIGTVNWSAISADAAMRVVKALLVAAREARLSRFRVCVSCDRSTPPEWMYDEDTCRECAGQDRGMVH